MGSVDEVGSNDWGEINDWVHGEGILVGDGGC